MEEGWIVIIKNINDENLYQFSFSPNAPLPGVGYMIYLPGKKSAYKVTYVYISYDEKDVAIFVEEV